MPNKHLNLEDLEVLTFEIHSHYHIAIVKIAIITAPSEAVVDPDNVDDYGSKEKFWWWGRRAWRGWRLVSCG